MSYFKNLEFALEEGFYGRPYNKRSIFAILITALIMSVLYSAFPKLKPEEKKPRIDYAKWYDRIDNN